MTETSRFWDGIAIGDAATAPYDADDEFAKVLQSLASADGAPNGGIVFSGVLNELACSGVASPIDIATGRAVVDGSWYENDAIKQLTVATPGATHYGYVILRKDTALQTVRLMVIEQAGSLPALTQTRGTTWDYPLCSFTITSGGVIAVTDLRVLSLGVSQGRSFTLLARTTLAAPAASVGFSSSALKDWSKYGSLKLVILGFTSEAVLGYKLVNIQFNGITSNSYDGLGFDFDNALETGGAAGAGPYISIGYLPTAEPAANLPGLIEVIIPYHNGTTFKKVAHGTFENYNPAGADRYDYGVMGGYWNSTAAITSILVFLSSTNFVAGTEIALYGLPGVL